MDKTDAQILHESVLKFRKWKEKNFPHITEDNDNGEWCFDSDELLDMVSAAQQYLKNQTVHEATEEVFDDLFYAIGRDNECEDLMDTLDEYEEWFYELCQYCFQRTDIHVRWQFASHLRYFPNQQRAIQMIRRFLSDKDTYVSHEALLSLCELDKREAETYATELWNHSDLESMDKVGALYALHASESNALEEALTVAEQSQSDYLLRTAAWIRQDLQKEKGKNV